MKVTPSFYYDKNEFSYTRNFTVAENIHIIIIIIFTSTIFQSRNSTFNFSLNPKFTLFLSEYLQIEKSKHILLTEKLCLMVQKHDLLIDSLK